MGATYRTQITDLYSSQFASWNLQPGDHLAALDLPQKPLFYWNGAMWLPVGGSFIAGLSAQAIATPGDITEDVLATINIPAGLIGPNGFVRVRTQWSCVNNANAKTAIVRYSGAAGTPYMAAALAGSLSGMFETVIRNRGTGAQVGDANGGQFGAVASAVITGAVDTTQISSIVISSLKGVAGDAMALEAYSVEVVPAP